MSRTKTRQQYDECYRFLRLIRQRQTPYELPDIDGHQWVWRDACDSFHRRNNEFGGWRNWWRFDKFDRHRPIVYRHTSIPF